MAWKKVRGKSTSTYVGTWRNASRGLLMDVVYSSTDASSPDEWMVAVYDVGEGQDAELGSLVDRKKFGMNRSEAEDWADSYRRDHE